MKLKLTLLLAFLIQQFTYTQTVTDIEGNVYNTVTIGEQVWMKENLRTTKLNNDTPIQNITNHNQWNNLTSPAYCWYNNNEALYKNTKGALYNWYTVGTENLCPTGWRVPSKNDWETLINYLSINGEEAVPKMRGIGSQYYNNNSCSNNSSGLSLGATGVHFNYDSAFDGISFWGGWWFSTEQNEQRAQYINIDDCYWGFSADEKIWGLAVRCIKNSGDADDDSAVPDISESNISIYPNPASSYINLQNFPNNSSIKLYNLQGALIKQWKNPNGTLNIADLPKGMYMLLLNADSKTYSSKLVIK